MRSTVFRGVGPALFALGAAAAAAGAQELPLGYVTARGSTVTPAYEGWYPNPDGTITLSWGFYNRNTEETLEIAVGPDNYIEPDMYDGIQPTHFPGGRQWGAFGIIVPADYEGDPVRWTLKVRGGTFTIPANTTAEWKIDARIGDANGNLPPELAFTEEGPWFVAPGGAYAKAEARVMEPTPLTLYARDDGKVGGAFGGSSNRVVPVTLTWFKHSGPGEVTFDYEERANRVPAEGGSMTTNATFSEPGEYVIRVRANDASGVSGAGHAQCCWSNAFFIVTVGESYEVP
jgi:hypothetical protein